MKSITISDGNQKHDIESAQNADPQPPPSAKYRKAEKDELARAHQVSYKSLNNKSNKFQRKTSFSIFSVFIIFK